MKARLIAGALILLAINLAWVWRIDLADKESEQRMNESRDLLMETSRELYLMNRGWEFAIRTNQQLLPGHLPVKQTNGTATELDELTGSGKTMVLVMSDRHCSSCVDQLLFSVRNEIPQTERGRILVLFSMNSPSAEQWRYREKILAGARFIEIEDGSLNLPLDSLDIPYIFMTGPESIADLAFTPYPSLEAQTHKYLSTIRKRYFN